MKMYLQVDERNRIFPCCVWYDDIIPDEDWFIEDISDDFEFAESHGIPLWKYINNEIVHRTDEEIQADIDAIPVPEPTDIEKLQADIDFLTMENEYFEEQNDQQQADIDYLLMITEEE